jgi:lysozyme family protein
MQLTDAWRAQYERNFASMVIHPAVVAEAEASARKINENRIRYEAVSARVGNVPWYLIGALHAREASLNFSCYLGDGEALNHPTHCVPRGRGPFHDFEAGAEDALDHEGFQHITDWSLPALLWHAECFNGLGYHDRGTPSPYIWAGSSIYITGKYGSDGHYDAHLTDKQLGVAVILATMARLGFIQLPQATAADSAPLAPVQGSAPIKPSTGGGPKVLNSLMLKMATQWALNRLGEGTTWVGMWATLHSSYNIWLNPQIETNLQNAGLLIVGAIAIGIKEGWHRAPVAA